MSIKKFATYEAIERLWLRIKQRYDKKLDSVTNKDDTIEVNSGREISARISSNKNNNLSVDGGLYVPKNNTLTFGPYKYDGSEDVSVAIYDGEYNNN